MRGTSSSLPISRSAAVFSRSSARVRLSNLCPYHALAGVAEAPCAVTDTITTTPTVARRSSAPGMLACTTSRASRSELSPRGPNQPMKARASQLIRALASTRPSTEGRITKITKAANARVCHTGTRSRMSDSVRRQNQWHKMKGWGTSSLGAAWTSGSAQICYSSGG
jgi:hypothetical protein